jgi:hypothetical protein
LEGFFKRKLPPAGDNENNHGDTSRTRTFDFSFVYRLEKPVLVLPVATASVEMMIHLAQGGVGRGPIN